MKADNDKLDHLIRTAIGRDGPAFDFERWKQTHRAQVDRFGTESAGQAGVRTLFLLGRRPLARVAVAAGLVVVAWLVATWLGPSTGGLAFGDVLAQTSKVQTFHATVYQDGKESEIWAKRPNKLRRVYDGDIIEISNGPVMWTINVPFNKATQKPSFHFDSAQRRGLDVVDHFLQVRFTEGLSGFFAEEPVGQIQRDGKVFDVYRMDFSDRYGTTTSEALVNAETHLVHSLTVQISQDDELMHELRLVVADYDQTLSDDLFTFEPSEGMTVTVEKPEPAASETTAAAGGATLSGRITWARNRKPVSDARLTLSGGNIVTTVDGRNRREFFEHVETDRDGYWHLAGAPKGPIRLSVRSWEFEWPTVPTFTTNLGTAKNPYVLVDGQGDYGGLNFKVYKPDEFYARVTAQVTNEDGEPVRDATAYLTYVDSGDVHQHVHAGKRGRQTTGRDGRFDDGDIWPTYQPVRLHVGHRDPNGPYPLRGIDGEPFIIESQQEYHHDIVLPYEREVTIQVLDVSGNPLEGVAASLNDNRWGGAFSASSYQLTEQVYSDATGVVHGSGLLPGEVFLVVLKRLDVDEPDLWNPLVTNIISATAPTDRSVPVIQVTFDARPILIEGTVDPGFAIKSGFVKVFITGEPGELHHMPLARVKTDDEGRFTMTGVPAGEIRLLYSATGFEKTSLRAEDNITLERGNGYRVEFTGEQLTVVERYPLP